jgi:hypothetical protein
LCIGGKGNPVRGLVTFLTVQLGSVVVLILIVIVIFVCIETILLAHTHPWKD